MRFRITFSESPSRFALVLKENDSFGVKFDESIKPECEPYEGPYEVTPSRETQILPTLGKMMTAEVTVNPIPSNYGLISYNGFEITVS